MPRSARRRWLFAAGDADLPTVLRRRDLLVRRFVLAEVLAPPVSQRENPRDLALQGAREGSR